MRKVKVEQPKFFALVNNFNTGKVEPYNVVPMLLASVTNSKGKIDGKKFVKYDFDVRKYVPVRDREGFDDYITDRAHYYFSGDCNYEFLKVDWPYSHTGMIKDSRPVKLDVWDQLEPNMPVLLDLLWVYVKPYIDKVFNKEK